MKKRAITLIISLVKGSVALTGGARFAAFSIPFTDFFGLLLDLAQALSTLQLIVSLLGLLPNLRYFFLQNCELTQLAKLLQILLQVILEPSLLHHFSV